MVDNRMFFNTRLNYDDEAVFEFRGKKYATIEHAIQATKVALVDVEAAERFTVDARTKAGAILTPAYAREMGGKKGLVVLNDERALEWNRTRDHVMEEVARAKYKVSPTACDALLATQNAELWYKGEEGRERCFHFEALRGELSCCLDSEWASGTQDGMDADDEESVDSGPEPL